MALKEICFNYLEQSLRKNNPSDYTPPRLCFKSYILEPSGSSGQYIPPAWQLHEGTLKLGNLQALLDHQGPRMLRMQDSDWPRTPRTRL